MNVRPEVSKGESGASFPIVPTLERGNDEQIRMYATHVMFWIPACAGSQNSLHPLRASCAFASLRRLSVILNFYVFA
jgi:hypothetical protein